MKRIIALLSAAAMVLSLCSCGKVAESKDDKSSESGGFLSGIISSGKKKSDEETTTAKTPEDLSHAADKIEKGRFDSFDGYSDEEKQKIKEYAEKDGYTLEYNEDGSGTLSNEEGSWYVGKGWTDSEYTEGVPPIDFGTITMSSEMEESEGKYYIFLVRDVSSARVKEYVESLEAAGFKDTGDSVIDTDSGIISFTGENDAKRVEAAYSSNGFTFKIVLK